MPASNYEHISLWCRVHGNRSFHCDMCGVCLDVNLRGNHKCREGSAHDECCVCSEVRTVFVLQYYSAVILLLTSITFMSRV